MKVICNACGVVIAVPSVKFVCCGCDNLLTVENDIISAVDMELIDFIEESKPKKFNKSRSSSNRKDVRKSSPKPPTLRN